MKIKICQLVVEKNIQDNFIKIVNEISKVQKDEWIIFPEAVVSGYYPEEEVYTQGLDWGQLQENLSNIEKLVIEKQCHCLVGSATKMNNDWFNSIYFFSYTNKTYRHDKTQPSRLDKKHFSAGNHVSAYEASGIKFGMLACRELIFPLLWADLKNQGAKIIFHLNNAIQPYDVLWKHILIARAMENSVFVVSVNNADSPQKLPSYIISPRGQVLCETMTEKEQTMNVEIDLNNVIDDLNQRKDY